MINKKEIYPIIKNNSKIEIYRQKLNYTKIKRDLKWAPKSNFKESLNNIGNTKKLKYKILPIWASNLKNKG